MGGGGREETGWERNRGQEWHGKEEVAGEGTGTARWGAGRGLGETTGRKVLTSSTSPQKRGGGQRECTAAPGLPHHPLSFSTPATQHSKPRTKPRVPHTPGSKAEQVGAGLDASTVGGEEPAAPPGVLVPPSWQELSLSTIPSSPNFPLHRARSQTLTHFWIDPSGLSDPTPHPP